MWFVSYEAVWGVICLHNRVCLQTFLAPIAQPSNRIKERWKKRVQLLKKFIQQFSIRIRISSKRSKGFVLGRYCFTGNPSWSTKNFSKFQEMSSLLTGVHETATYRLITPPRRGQSDFKKITYSYRFYDKFTTNRIKSFNMLMFSRFIRCVCNDQRYYTFGHEHVVEHISIVL